MDEKKRKQASGPVKWILIGISVIFLFVMLVLPRGGCCNPGAEQAGSAMCRR